jgi:hypothetical protein
LLARASDPQSGLERVLENMRKFNVPEDKLASLSVDNILIGDLSQPEAFLNDPRLDQVTHVVNCAAVASFGNNPLIWKVNVEGTLRWRAVWSRLQDCSVSSTSAPQCHARRSRIHWSPKALNSERMLNTWWNTRFRSQPSNS